MRGDNLVTSGKLPWDELKSDERRDKIEKIQNALVSSVFNTWRLSPNHKSRGGREPLKAYVQELFVRKHGVAMPEQYLDETVEWIDDRKADLDIEPSPMERQEADEDFYFDPHVPAEDGDSEE